MPIHYAVERNAQTGTHTHRRTPGGQQTDVVAVARVVERCNGDIERRPKQMGDERPIAYIEGETVIYRASSVGHVCIAQLVAARLGYVPVPPPAFLQERFDEGTDAEPVVLARMADEGWEISGEQAEYHLEIAAGVKVRMHLDAIGVDPMLGGKCVVEVKAFGPDYWDQFTKHGLKSFEGYAWQTSIQMHATGLPLAFVVVRKPDRAKGEAMDRSLLSTAEIVVERAEEPLIPLGHIKAKVMKAEMYARKSELPPCAGDKFPCSFPYLHEGTTERDEVEDRLLDAAADYLEECRMNKSAWEEKEKAARARVIEVLGDRDKVATKRFDVARVKSVRKGLDRKGLEKAHPEIAAEYATETETEQIRVKKVEV